MARTTKRHFCQAPDCGAELPYSGQGRPFLWCGEHQPRKAETVRRLQERVQDTVQAAAQVTLSNRKEALVEGLKGLGVDAPDEKSGPPRALWGRLCAIGVGLGLTIEQSAAMAGLPALSKDDAAELKKEIAEKHSDIVQQKATSLIGLSHAAMSMLLMRIITSIDRMPPSVLGSTLGQLGKVKTELQGDSSSFAPISINIKLREKKPAKK